MKIFQFLAFALLLVCKQISFQNYKKYDLYNNNQKELWLVDSNQISLIKNYENYASFMGESIFLIHTEKELHVEPLYKLNVNFEKETLFAIIDREKFTNEAVKKGNNYISIMTVQKAQEESFLERYEGKVDALIRIPTTPIKKQQRKSFHLSKLELFIENPHRYENIQNLLSLLNSTKDIEYYSTFLTGENPSSPFKTRHSFSKDGLKVAHWLRNELTSFGFHCEYFWYNVTGSKYKYWNPNVICDWLGNYEKEEMVILGAHYDDRQKGIYDETQKAPGANDDASGTTLLLQLAKLFSIEKPAFRHKVQFCFFSGEEQGLYGSEYYARYSRKQQVPIKLMIQVDMVGKEKEVSFITGFVDNQATVQSQKIIRKFLPEMIVSDSNACCSDHQSFYTQGYRSIGLVESGGYRVDPEYHQPGDLVYRHGYDLTQILAIAKAVLSVLSTVAELQ